MYILGLLVILLIGVWFVPFAVHIGIKVHQIYFEIEAVIRVFGHRVVRRKWQGDWLKRLIEKWKEPSTAQTTDEKESGKNVRGIVLNLLRIGRWKTFIWRTEVGLDDAMITAIAVGGIWGLQGIIWERWIRDSNCRTEMICRPNFGELILCNEVICIVHFRFGDIIKEFTKGYLKSKRRKVA